MALISIISFLGMLPSVALADRRHERDERLSHRAAEQDLGFNGHVYVRAGDQWAGPRRAVQRLRAVPACRAAPMVEAQAVAKVRDAPRGHRARHARRRRARTGSSPAYQDGALQGFGVGDYGGDLILVGARLADTLGVKAGDPVTLISPSRGDAVRLAPEQDLYGRRRLQRRHERIRPRLYLHAAGPGPALLRRHAWDEIEVNLNDPDHLDRIKAASCRRPARRSRHRLARPQPRLFRRPPGGANVDVPDPDASSS